MKFPVRFDTPVPVIDVQGTPAQVLSQFKSSTGAVMQFTVPSSKLWKLEHLYLTYSASTVYGDRQMQLLFGDENLDSLCEIGSSLITRGRTLRQSLYPSASASFSPGPVSTDFEIATCPSVLNSGYTIILGAEGIQAGDTYSIRIKYYEL